MLENKYRPKDWCDLILPKQGKTKLQVAMVKQAIDKGARPLRVFITGESGTGKTSLAKVIASNIGNVSVLIEVDGKDVDRAMVKQWREWFTVRNAFGHAVVIVNEAQNMGAACEAIMTLCDAMKSGVIIFTTMNTQKTVFASEQVDEAIKARCMQVNITTQGLAEQAAIRLLEVARIEELDFGADAKRVLRLLQDNHNNIRATLQAIGDGALCPAGEIGAALADKILTAKAA